MTKTSRERRHFPVPMRCPYAGNDPGQRIPRSLISSNRLPRHPSHAVDLTSVQIPRSILPE